MESIHLRALYSLQLKKTGGGRMRILIGAFDDSDNWFYFYNTNLEIEPEERAQNDQPVGI